MSLCNCEQPDARAGCERMTGQGRAGAKRGNLPPGKESASADWGTRLADG